MENTRHHILVVDDDDDLRTAIRQSLEDEGYSVTEASNGREALRALAAPGATIDLVLLDLMMPVMSGWEFLTQLRCDPRIGQTKVVVLTATPDRCPADVSACVKKPFSTDRLLDAVRAHARVAA
jgi:CheY-like chemotaxis protein